MFVLQNKRKKRKFPKKIYKKDELFSVITLISTRRAKPTVLDGIFAL